MRPLPRHDKLTVDESPTGAGAVFVDPHQHSHLIPAGFEIRERTRREIGANAIAANSRVDGLDALGQRPGRTGSLQRQGPVATEQRLDRFAKAGPEFHLTGD